MTSHIIPEKPARYVWYSAAKLFENAEKVAEPAIERAPITSSPVFVLDIELDVGVVEVAVFSVLTASSDPDVFTPVYEGPTTRTIVLLPPPKVQVIV